MSLSVIAATVATAEAGSSPTGVTVNVPAGTQNGDLMVAFGMVTTSAGTVSAPSGWTSLDFQNTSGPTMRTFWRKALSEPASYSVAMSANQNMVAAIVTLRGQDGTTPIDVHGALTRTALSATLTGATITTDTDGCMLIFLGGGGSNSAFTGPSSFTQQIVGSDSCSGLIATMLQTTAGATGAITATFNTGAPNNCAGLIAVKPAPSAPTNTVAPVVSGTTTVGQTLSTTNGSWTGSPSFTYQWQRDNHGGGTYSNIGAATSSTYLLVDLDDGCNIRCVVTGTNGGGSASANSNSLGTVVEPAPSNVTAPAVTGLTPQGSLLSCSQGTWLNMAGYLPSYAYQWTRDGSNIAAATASTYTTVGADVGHAVGCTVTATNTGGSTAQASNTVTVTSTGGTTVAVTLAGASMYLRKRHKLLPAIEPPR